MEPRKRFFSGMQILFTCSSYHLSESILATFRSIPFPSLLWTCFAQKIRRRKGGRMAPYLTAFALVTMLFPSIVTSQASDARMDSQGNVYISENPPTEQVTVATASTPTMYGVDASWPMQHRPQRGVEPPRDNPLSLEVRQQAYMDYLSGCYGPLDKFKDACREWEADRLSMNLEQPMTSQNYTYAGYAKVETPPLVRHLVQKAWERHAYKSEKLEEQWERSNTYLNHWKSPTFMADIQDLLTPSEESQLIHAVQSVLEAWTQQSLILTSLYGIRIYTRGAILAPHVDRLPLVTSAIIPVDQQVDEEWPLEVIGRDGLARNITSHTGDMILYESHSTIHGRPFALQGDHYANIFLHFEPINHSMRHAQQISGQETAQESFERAWKHHQQQQQDEEDEEAVMDDNSLEAFVTGDYAAPSPTLPYYVPPEKEARWNQQFEYEKEVTIVPKPTRVALGAMTSPHLAAADGSLHLLKEIAAVNKAKLFSKDHNGWTPLHEAARAGHVAVIQYLLDEGAQINERTHFGIGSTPLWWAELKKRTEAIALLKKHGGVALAPGSAPLTNEEIPDAPDTEATPKDPKENVEAETVEL